MNDSNYNNREFCESIVKINGLELSNIYLQTEEMCMSAVKENGLALKYVSFQTPEICEMATRQNKLASKYVINKKQHQNLNETLIDSIDIKWNTFLCQSIFGHIKSSCFGS